MTVEQLRLSDWTYHGTIELPDNTDDETLENVRKLTLDVGNSAYVQGFEAGKKDMAEKILAKITEKEVFWCSSNYVRKLIEEVQE